MNNLDMIFAIITAIIFTIVIVVSRRTKSFDGFAVSNQTIGLFLIFLSFSATFIGPGFSLALVSQGFNSGYTYLYIAGFYGLAKIIEGKIFAPVIRTKFKNALSIGDIIAGKDSHNNKLLHILIGILSFALLIGFSSVLSKAGGIILNNLFDLKIEYATIIMTGIVIVYSFFGGIKATILTDAFQFILFVILTLILFIILLYTSEHPQDIIYSTFKTSQSGLANIGFSGLLGFILTWFLGEMLIPPTINRILSTKTPGISKKGLIYSGLFMIIWLFIMLSIGVLGKVLLPNAEGTDQLFLDIGKNYLDYGLYGVFTIAIIGIVMSSQDSLINSASVVFANDIIASKTKTKKLKIAQISTVLVGILSIVISLYLPSILSGLLLIYSLWVPAILTPLLASIFLKKLSWKAAVISIFTGIISSLVWRHLPINDFIPAIIASFTLSIIGYTLGLKIFKK